MTTINTNSTNTNYTITGLTNDVAYRVRVAAVNAIGTGPFTSYVTGKPSAISIDPYYYDNTLLMHFDDNRTGTYDQYGDYVSLLMHMDGTNNVFVDNSLSPKMITAVGNATQSATQSKWGGKSLTLDGSNSNLSLSSSEFVFSGDFVIEGWIYLSSNPIYSTIIDTRSSPSFSDFVAGVYSISGGHRLDFVTGGGVRLTASSTSVPLGSWSYFAFVRSAGVISVYVDGVRDATQLSYSASISPASATALIGRNVDGNFINGYIDDFRITNGSTRGYTGSTITVPTSQFPPVIGSFIDSSAYNNPLIVSSTSISSSSSKFGGYAGYFNGSSSVRSAGTDIWQLGTDDFTVESWFNPSNLTGRKSIVGNYDGSNGGWALAIKQPAGGTPTYGPEVTFTKTDYGNESDVIIPGVLEIYRGSAQGLYNRALESSYDRSVSPSNTLWNRCSNFIYDGYSGYCDGGDTNNWDNICDYTSRTYGVWYPYATNGNNTPSMVGKELIMKHAPTNRYWLIKFTNWQSNNQGGAFAYTRKEILGCVTNSSVVEFRNGDSPVITKNTATPITTGEWHHIAAVRSSGSLSLYLDGQQLGSSDSFTSNITRNNSYGLSIGACTLSNGSSSDYFNGYLDDLRITKGVARYLENFVSPISSFPNNGPAQVELLLETSIGSDVVLSVPKRQPSDIGISLNFDSVVSSGVTTILVINPNLSAPELPANFVVGDSLASFSISSTANFSGDIVLDFYLSESISQAAFDSCRIFKVSGGVTTDVTILSGPNAPNFATKKICALVTSFSDFFIIPAVAPSQNQTPSSPTNVIASLSGKDAIVSFSVPSSDGGSSITNYIIQYSKNNGTTWTDFTRATSTATSNILVNNLLYYKSYIFRVVAVNSVGNSSPSSSSNSIVTPPGIVGNLYGKYTSIPSDAQMTNGDLLSLPMSSPSLYSSIDYGDVGDNYGFIAIGYFVPPTDGTYTFYTSSDDGSAVWIGSIAEAGSGRNLTNAIVNNNSTGWQGDTERGGSISLISGTFYAIRIIHREGEQGSNLRFSWAGPGISKRTSLATYFYANNFGSEPPTILSVSVEPYNGYLKIIPTVSSSNVTYFTISYSSNNGNNWTTFGNGQTAYASSVDVTGLTNGVNYKIRITATNSIGTSEEYITENYSPNANSVSPLSLANGFLSALRSDTVNDSEFPNAALANGCLSVLRNDTISEAEFPNVALANGYLDVLRIDFIFILPILPDAPTSLAATAGNAQVSLTWTAPSPNGGSAIIDYSLQFSSNGGSTWTTFVDGTSTATSATVTGLTTGTAYVFRVAAVNAVGVGAYTAASAAVTPTAVTPDPFFSSVALLMHMDGSGSTFVDASAVPKTITAVGNATQSTAQSKWGGKSAYFDGSGDYLSVIGDVASFGTSDFAVEFWLYYTGTGTQYSIFDTRSSSSGLAIYKATDDTLRVYESSDIISGGAISANTWHHIALARSGSDIRLFLNGTQTGSTFSTLHDYSDQLLTVGADFPRNGRWTQGYIDDLRITKGSARSYTGSTITVPTAAFPTDGPMSAPTSLAATGGNAQVSLTWTAPSYNGGSAITGYRVEYTPSGGSPTVVSTGSTSTSYTLTGLTNGTAYTVRVAGINANGTGTYTAASAAVTPVAGDALFANVALLLPMDGTGASFVDASAVPKAITAVGNATQSTAQSKWGGKSAAFDGSGDYLTAAVPAFGSSDFVVEMWAYFTSMPGNYTGLFDARAEQGRYPTLILNGSSIAFFTNSSFAINGGTVATGQWHHIALARSSGTTRLYLNGSQTGSVFTDSNNYLSSASTVIGSLFDGYGLNGYIDDLRITVGSARGYTGSTITVPTAAFPTDSPMSAPTSLAATGGNAQVSLTWTAPSYNGGSAITDYSVQFSSNSGSTWTTFSRTASNTASQVVSGLTNGTAYVFRVAGINANGTGTYTAASAAVTPRSFAPTSITGLQLWLDAADSATLFDATTGGSLVAADGGVARWEDKSGNGRHATQGTAANRPVRKTAIQGGRDVLRFDGSNDSLSIPSSTATFKFLHGGSTGYTAFAVVSARSLNTRERIFETGRWGSNIGDAGGFGASWNIDSDGSFRYDASAGSTNVIANTSSAGLITAGSWYVLGVSGIANSGTASLRSAMRRNGGTAISNNAQTGAASSSNARTDLTIARGIGYNGDGTLDYEQYADLDIAEIIIYNSALIDADRSAIESYLMSKYSIS